MPGRAAAPTFRGRLTVTMTALSVAVLLAGSAAIYLGVRHELLSNLDAALLAMARAEVASAVDEPDQGVHVHELGPAPLSPSSGSGYEKLARIADGNGRILAETANLKSAPLNTDAALEARALGGAVSFSNLERGGEAYRAVYYPLPDAGGEPLVAVVAIPKSPVERSLQILLVALSLALVVGATASAWAAGRLSRRLIRPLEQIAVAAAGVGERSLGERIPQASPDVELCNVVDILNAMLARLESAFAVQKQLVEAQQRFVLDASHELRSPLANLRGTIEVALRRPRSDGDYREALQVSLAESERLSRLVEGLLTLSRVDAGTVALHRVPCDLAEIARESVRAHEARAQETNVRLRFSAAQPLPLKGDADRLREAVDNLLDNALRYAPADSEVEVLAAQQGGRLTLSVRDGGRGMSPDDRARVFDRFYRADESRARFSGGLGLGLAIARAVVEAHGGEIAVDSQPGKGSTFSIALPAVTAGAGENGGRR